MSARISRGAGKRLPLALVAVAVFTSPLILAAPVKASHCDTANHCYAINIETSAEGYITAAGAKLWSNCLYAVAPDYNIATHELWLHTNAQAGVTTWVEVGLIHGLAAGGSATYLRWFWGDYRGSWDNFNQHVLSSIVNYERYVSVWHPSGYDWAIFVNGVHVGTSYPNGNLATQAEVGDETTTAAAYAYGTANQFQVRRGTTWYSAGGNASVHYPPYYFSFNGPSNFGVSTVNRCGAAATAQVSGGPISEEQAVEVAKRVATANGESSPSDGLVTRSRRQTAQEVVTGANVDSDEDVYVVELHGRFVGYMASVPAGAPLPKGGTVIVTIGSETGEILDWSLGDRRPDLSILGATRALSF